MRWKGTLLALLSVAGCGSDAASEKDDPWDCGVQTCPVGTSPHQVQSLEAMLLDDSALVDVSDGPRDDAAIGGQGYVLRSEATCEFACVAIEPCPTQTVPIITEDCFTCAELTESGEIVSAGCDFDGDFVQSDPPEPEEEALPDPEEIPGDEGSAPSCYTSWRWIVEGDFDGNMSVDRDYDDFANEPQQVGEIDESITLSGRLDREEASVPGCADEDHFVGEFTCEGTANLLLSSSGTAAMSVTIGDVTYTRSTADIAVEPGPFEAHFACSGDWASYDLEVDFGG